MRRPLLLAVAAVLLTGCGAPGSPPAAAPALTGAAAPPAPAPAPAAPAPAALPPAPPPPPDATQSTAPVPSSPGADPSWVLGAVPLPLRADGFGQVRETPSALRDRRLTLPGTLPPPDGRFQSTVTPITAAVRSRMGTSWFPGCPVGLADLRYLTVSFRGFDGAAHTGELVVSAAVAEDVVEVFRRLFAADFPIEQMRLVTTADLEAAPTGDGNNTASYVCRKARGQSTWSQHAYGLAVDVNPFHNPLVKRDLVLPELAGAYADRGRIRPGMHLPGGAAVRAFAAVGWGWGGSWRGSKDYMHFSATGR